MFPQLNSYRVPKNLSLSKILLPTTKEIWLIRFWTVFCCPWEIITTTETTKCFVKASKTSYYFLLTICLPWRSQLFKIFSKHFPKFRKLQGGQKQDLLCAQWFLKSLTSSTTDWPSVTTFSSLKILCIIFMSHQPKNS